MNVSGKSSSDLLALTTQIVAAHVSKNSVSVGDVPKLIQQVHAALDGLGGGAVSGGGRKAAAAASAPAAAPVARTSDKPAVRVGSSIKEDYIVCLEDGTKHKLLKRHLRKVYGMTPEQYREKWGLPKDYPMVAPSYSKVRSKLAKAAGLGTKRMRKRAGRRAAA